MPTRFGRRRRINHNGFGGKTGYVRPDYEQRQSERGSHYQYKTIKVTKVEN